MRTPANMQTTPERRKTMSKIRATGGKTETQLAKALWHRGIRYRRNFRKAPGTPDIALTRYRIAIFVDGEFWHGYDWPTRKIKGFKNNHDFWVAKIERNMQRDIEVNAALDAMGWYVLRFWEKDLKMDMDKCIQQIEMAITYKKELQELVLRSD